MASVPRPSRFSNDDVFDATLAAIVEHGAEASIGQIAQRLGGAVGSIYHRFGSRDELITRLWLRCVQRFHAGHPALADPGGDPRNVALASATYVPVYCAEHPDEAIGLTLRGQATLLKQDDLDPGLRQEITTLNDAVIETLKSLAARLYGAASASGLRQIDLAVRTMPYGIVRPYLGRPVPPLVINATTAAAAAILDLEE